MRPDRPGQTVAAVFVPFVLVKAAVVFGPIGRVKVAVAFVLFVLVKAAAESVRIVRAKEAAAKRWPNGGNGNWNHNGNWNGNHNWNHNANWNVNNNWNHNWNGNNNWNHYHPNWWHGNWHGNWNRPWYRPAFWGWGAFGVGALAYGSGYYDYYNPYYVEGDTNVTYLNYSEPLQEIDPTLYAGQTMQRGRHRTGRSQSADWATAECRDGRRLGCRAQRVSRGRLRRRDERRGPSAQPGSAQTPAIHEFRALVLFAQGQYDEAAAAIHSVLGRRSGLGLDHNGQFVSQHRRLYRSASPARSLLQRPRQGRRACFVGLSIHDVWSQRCRSAAVRTSGQTATA